MKEECLNIRKIVCEALEEADQEKRNLTLTLAWSKIQQLKAKLNEDDEDDSNRAQHMLEVASHELESLQERPHVIWLLNKIMSHISIACYNETGIRI